MGLAFFLDRGAGGSSQLVRESQREARDCVTLTCHEAVSTVMLTDEDGGRVEGVRKGGVREMVDRGSERIWGARWRREGVIDGPICIICW